MINACQHTRDDTGGCALPALRYLAGCLVRVRSALLVFVLLAVFGYCALVCVDTRTAHAGPDAQQSTWRVGEITELQSWYWAEVPKAPQVKGGYGICAPITGGQRCVLVTQGEYRYLMADGVIVEDRRYKVRLLQVWR